MEKIVPVGKFKDALQWAYVELKECANAKEWETTPSDCWIDDQYNFIRDYIEEKFGKVEGELALVVKYELLAILDINEISLQQACVECVKFIDDTFNI